MKTKNVLLMSVMMAFLPLSSVQINAKVVDVPLQVDYNDPNYGQSGPQRGPVLIPEVGIEYYTLTFSTPCNGFTLELLDENGDVAYSTIVTSATVFLPSALSGTYKLCLVPTDSNIYFYGYVMF